jgi:glutaredoxin-related protein
MKIILYTTHCPMCTVLEEKLQDANFEYDTVEDP